MAALAYEFVDSVTSDLSFVARGGTPEQAFAAAAEALLAASVADPATVRDQRTIPLRLEDEDLELLLLAFLGELIWRRDAEALLLRAGRLRIQHDGRARLEGELVGEPIDPARHALEADVKAATAHGLRVAPVGDGWEARVTLDV